MWLRINLPLHARTKFKETLTPQLYPPRHGDHLRLILHRAIILGRVIVRPSSMTMTTMTWFTIKAVRSHRALSRGRYDYRDLSPRNGEDYEPYYGVPGGIGCAHG